MRMGRGNEAIGYAGRGLHGVRGLTLLAAVLGLMRLPCAASAQMAKLGSIEFYGLQKVSEASVRQALQVNEGDVLPNSGDFADAMEKRLRALPNVEDAKVNGVCCVKGEAVLFVGIEEKGGRSLHFRAAPKGKVRLSDKVTQAGEDYDKALQAAVLAGDAQEDDSQGYALARNPELRAVQQRFLIFASFDTSDFQDVLLHASDEGQRALAAMVLGYAIKNDQSIVNDLVTGMSDPDPGVRNNAMRALAVRALYNISRPQAQIKIPYDPFIHMLNSLEWTDRNKACFALLQLSEKKDQAFFKSLRKEALPALKEMARWTKSGYGQPAFIILGRMNGLSDPEILTAWQSENYAKVLGAFKD